jgi:ornithine decarboxylase
MIPRDVKAPTVPIPFHKLLKVVAIVDAKDPQTKQLLDHIAAENFEIEVSDSFDRDISEV